MAIIFHNEPDGRDTSRAIGAQHNAAAEPEVATSTPALDEYLSQFPAMRAGKVRATLEKQQRFSGAFHPRHVYAEMLATSNKTVQVNPMENRVYTDLKAHHFYTYADVTKSFADYLSWLIWDRAA